LQFRPQSHMFRRDCADILKSNASSPSGVYNLRINENSPEFPAYCDMTTNGGGWTVFQRRIDGSEVFYRPWSDYVSGFGSLTKEFWLGNDRLASLTTARQYNLRVDLGDWSNAYRYAEYNRFKISDSNDKYRLTLGSYRGNAGDSMAVQRGMQFSTYDQDNDVHVTDNCASAWRGAWWYERCHNSNLNGEYNSTEDAKGLCWLHWHGWAYTLRFSEMKIRPVNF